VKTDCPSGSTSPVGSPSRASCSCLPGLYNLLGSCLVCPPGSYCVGGSVMSNMVKSVCPAGSFCPSGVSAPTACGSEPGDVLFDLV
jgi:hypothetical protein